MEHFDVVVIGSGAFGASTAFHLANSGKNVALVDQAAIASQTSSRAAGLTGQLRASAAMIRIARRAVEKFERFEEETGQKLEYVQSGSISLARTEEHADLMRRAAQWASQHGLEVELLSPEKAHELQPFLQPEGSIVGLYTPSDLYLEPAQLAEKYALAAEKLGATLLPNTRVTDLIVENGAVSRVVTDAGDIGADIVVDAAGGWLRRVADFARAEAPVVPMRHQLMITVPLPEVDPAQPVVRILDVNIYVRPCHGGLMLGGYETDPRPVDTRSVSAGFRVEDLDLDEGVLRTLAEKVYEQFPVFRDVELQELRGGLPTMTADGEHVVGPAPDVQGLYLIGGCNVGGLSVSPALGENLARWIVEGQAPQDLSQMSPARFVRPTDDDELVRKAVDRYAHYYVGQ